MMIDTALMRRLTEAKLAECSDINKAPFGLDHDQSTAFMSGKASALQWVLEMLPVSAPLPTCTREPCQCEASGHRPDLCHMTMRR